MEKKKKKEQQIINEMVVQIEKGTGMKCKVVPQSDKWYDGYCFDTSAILASFGATLTSSVDQSEIIKACHRW